MSFAACGPLVALFFRQLVACQLPAMALWGFAYYILSFVFGDVRIDGPKPLC